MSICIGDVSIYGLILQPSHFLLSDINVNDLTESIPTLLFVKFLINIRRNYKSLISGSIVSRMKNLRLDTFPYCSTNG